jgi:hypothetical protein
MQDWENLNVKDLAPMISGISCFLVNAKNTESFKNNLLLYKLFANKRRRSFRKAMIN